jgi:probable rRNA maturation factor
MSHIVDLQIACNTDEVPSIEQFQRWVDNTLNEVMDSSDKSIFELTIRLVDKNESQQLNCQYRGIDKPTNVLSFPFEVPDDIELNLLGDLVICIDVMKKEAQSQNKALFDHWAHLVIHGCLHLVGFDHISDNEATIMEALEVKILETLNINNPYTIQ